MMLSDHRGGGRVLQGQPVLILVLLDDALRRAKSRNFLFLVDVLILVLLDDALRHFVNLYYQEVYDKS